MHVLRAEKGYIIVGQDTDGTATPFDLGMDWIVSKAKPDFVGKRGLQQPAVRAAGRKQLVGLLPVDPGEVVEEGTQIVAMPEPGSPPVPMIGHVTSSYLSPNVGRSIAMAMVRGGHGLHGETVYIPMPKRVIAAKVTRPCSSTRRGSASMAKAAAKKTAVAAPSVERRPALAGQELSRYERQARRAAAGGADIVARAGGFSRSSVKGARRNLAEPTQDLRL